MTTDDVSERDVVLGLSRAAMPRATQEVDCASHDHHSLVAAILVVAPLSLVEAAFYRDFSPKR